MEEFDRLVSMVAWVIGELLPLCEGKGGLDSVGLGVLRRVLRAFGDLLGVLDPFEEPELYGPFDRAGPNE